MASDAVDGDDQAVVVAQLRVDDPRDRGLIEFLVEAIGATDEGHVRVERTHDGGLEAVSGDAAVGDVVMFCHGVTG